MASNDRPGAAHRETIPTIAPSYRLSESVRRQGRNGKNSLRVEQSTPDEIALVAVRAGRFTKKMRYA